ncbi:MAG: hypothetical protein M1330_01270 [Armatimonadetes bacterium]|nr:hypothetical protein [Armatimonadota bacterium]
MDVDGFVQRGLAFEGPNWTLQEWKSKINWMAAHNLNTLILFMDRACLQRGSLDQYPDLKPYLPYIMGYESNAGAKLNHEVIHYCHSRAIKVILVLGIDVNDDIVANFPQLRAVRPPGTNCTNILCPSRPEVQEIYRDIWVNLVKQYPESDGFGIMPPDSGQTPCVCDICKHFTPAQIFGAQVSDLYEIAKAAAPKAIFVTWVGYGYMEKYAKQYASAFPRNVVMEVHRYDVFDSAELEKVIHLWVATDHPVWFKMALYRFAWIEQGKPAPVRILGPGKIKTVIDAAKEAGATGMFGFCAANWDPAKQNIDDFAGLLGVPEYSPAHK